MVDLPTKIRFEAFIAALQTKKRKTYTQIQALTTLLDYGENQLSAEPIESEDDQAEQEAKTSA
jgi:hypothetical protein